MSMPVVIEIGEETPEEAQKEEGIKYAVEFFRRANSSWPTIEEVYELYGFAGEFLDMQETSMLALPERRLIVPWDRIRIRKESF